MFKSEKWKHTNETKTKKTKTSKSKPKKIKTFDDYFQECIKTKSNYLGKALQRAIKEYQAAVILEKSALDNFAKNQALHQNIFSKNKPRRYTFFFQK